MKKFMFLVLLVAALCAVLSITATAAPYSVDLTISNAATNVANFAVSQAVQPVNLT